MVFFFPVACIVSLVVLGLGLNWLLRASAATRWPTVSGKVIRSTVTEDTFDGAPIFEADVAYEYAVGGQAIIGHRIRFGEFSTTSRERAAAETSRWPVGAQVTVHYDPRGPATAVLETPRPVLGVWLVAAGVLGLVVVALAAGAVALWGPR